MNRIVLSIFFFCALFLCENSYAQKSKVVKTKYFQNLVPFDADNEYQWYTGNNELASELEKSYNTYSKKKKFKKFLFKFADNNVDKYYWLATYLNDDYYTQINDQALSIELYTLGLALAEKTSENEEIRYLFVLGKYFYYKGDKEKSLKYLTKGYRLSEKYPGNVPTWNNIEEADIIYNFIKENL